MTRKNYLITLLILIFYGQTFGQTADVLRQQIQQIVSTKHAIVGVSIVGQNGKDTLSLHGDKLYPLQSVFKYHIALVVLSQIDKGKFSINQKIEIKKKDLLLNLYSPLREDYPEGASLPISKILEYTVSSSDNIGCDILLRLIGGTKVVDDYFKENGIENISIKYNEEEQQTNTNLQLQNWTTPKAATEALSKFYYNKNELISKESHDFIWKIMRETQTGRNRLRGKLPQGTIVAHKTGSSGVNKQGITLAVNDIGIVFLPNGKHFFISVFVTNSIENAETNEEIIADIAKVTWDYFMDNTK